MGRRAPSEPTMASFLWKYPVRELRRRPGRALLTLCGIVLGVAGVASTIATTQVTRRAYAGLYRDLAGRATLEIIPDGRRTFQPDLEAIENVSGVLAAVPLL